MEPLYAWMVLQHRNKFLLLSIHLGYDSWLHALIQTLRAWSLDLEDSTQSYQCPACNPPIAVLHNENTFWFSLPANKSNQINLIWPRLHLPLLHVILTHVCFLIRAFAPTLPSAWNIPSQPYPRIFTGLPPCHQSTIHHPREVLLAHPPTNRDLPSLS